MENDTGDLVAKERQLLKYEKWIEGVIKNIKAQKINLQVERLQLQSMLEAEKRKSNPLYRSSEKTVKKEVDKHSSVPLSAPCIPTSELDRAESSYNTETLNLSVLKNVDDMLAGKFYVEGESEEESEDDLLKDY